MKYYLLDTSVVIAYLRNYKETILLVKRFFEEGSVLCCCPVIITEVYAGMRDKEKGATGALIDSLHFFPIDRDIAKQAGGYIKRYREKGITLSLADTLIAATAVAKNLTLVTYNTGHYPMKELSIFILTDHK